MRELLQILQPARHHWRWMAAGIVLGVVVIAANTALMAVSGWFIASMAVAGAAKLSFNFFFPSAAIRLLAILRTVGRYGERLVTHEAAFHILASLRVWFFKRLIPLAPAGLQRYAGGDLAGRLRADVDSLENLYLRIIRPTLHRSAQYPAGRAVCRVVQSISRCRTAGAVTVGRTAAAAGHPEAGRNAGTTFGRTGR